MHPRPTQDAAPPAPIDSAASVAAAAAAAAAAAYSRHRRLLEIASPASQAADLLAAPLPATAPSKKATQEFYMGSPEPATEGSADGLQGSAFEEGRDWSTMCLEPFASVVEPGLLLESAPTKARSPPRLASQREAEGERMRAKEGARKVEEERIAAEAAAAARRAEELRVAAEGEEAAAREECLAAERSAKAAEAAWAAAEERVAAQEERLAATDDI